MSARMNYYADFALIEIGIAWLLAYSGHPILGFLIGSAGVSNCALMVAERFK
jgi:hypothetical protein